MMSVTLNNVVVTAKKVDKSIQIREERSSMYSNPSYSFGEEALSKATSIKKFADAGTRCKRLVAMDQASQSAMPLR